MNGLPDALAETGVSVGFGSVLAFGFGSPWLLGGLVLGGIPILIHLLHKRQFQETSWAAMRFLLAATRRNSRRLRLQQLLLLAVRTFAILCLVFAMAKPLLESSVLPVARTEPVHRVIVVDASASMQRVIGTESAFEQACQHARTLIESANTGDVFQLVQICDQSERIIVAEPAWDANIMVNEVGQLQPTWEMGRPLEALQDVEQLLENVDEPVRKQVTIISDFQTTNWSPVESVADSIRESLQSISESGSLNLLSVSSSISDNVAVTELAVDSGPSIVGEKLAVSATIQRWGETAQAEATLFVNQRPVNSKSVEFAKGDSANVRFEFEPSEAGELEVSVQLTGDDYSPDDNRWAAASVLEDINVLLVNGRQSGRPMGNASDFVKLSLVPADSPEVDGPIRVRTVTDGELMSVDATDYQCIFLCNVGLLTEPETDLLSRYARAGGGVVFLVGDQVRADVWNRLLYEDGNGLSPVQLLDRNGNASDPQDAFVFNTSELTHPLVSDYRGNPGYGLENVLTLEYFKSKLSTSRNAIPVLAFENGDPCIVDSKFGNGRTIVVLTSADDRRWCTWNTIGGTFAAFANETVRYLVGDRPPSSLVGRPVSIPTDVTGISEVTIASPDGQRHTLSDAGETGQFTFRNTTVPGIYRATNPGSDDSRLYAVNVDPAESDTGFLSDERLSEELLDGVDFEFAGSNDTNSIGQMTSGRAGNRLSMMLLWCVGALLLVEQVMAWRFGLGVTLLLLFLATFATSLAVTGKSTFWLLVPAVVIAIGVAAIVHSKSHRATR